MGLVAFGNDDTRMVRPLGALVRHEPGDRRLKRCRLKSSSGFETGLER